MAETAEFDILALMDVVKRFGFDVYGEFEGGRYVTLGSDTHQPDHVGYALETAAAGVTAAGSAGPTWYRGREPQPADG